jgi:hypothetical protein
VEVARESFLPILRGDPREYQRDNQFYRLLKVVETVPEKLPYSGEALILRPLYHYIPRAIWKNKPMGVTGYFETAMKEPGVGVTTFAVSMPGEFYLCQGWLGVCIAGIFMGFLAKQFDSLVDMSKRSPAVLLVYAYGITFLFVSIRSYQVIFGSWYVFIFMYLALAAARKKGPILWKT